MITQLKEKVLNGGQITREEAILLSNAVDKQALYRAAGEIRDNGWAVGSILARL